MDAYEVGAPVFVSEFGGCGRDDRCVYEIGQVARLANADLMSWAVRTDMLS
jgi:hypothetical protein